jgi:hypothetical protein
VLSLRGIASVIRPPQRQRSAPDLLEAGTQLDNSFLIEAYAWNGDGGFPNPS